MKIADRPGDCDLAADDVLPFPVDHQTHIVEKVGEWLERCRIYQLLDCLVFWEYGQRNRLWFRDDQRFRSFAEHFVSVLQPFPDSRG